MSAAVRWSLAVLVAGTCTFASSARADEPSVDPNAAPVPAPTAAPSDPTPEPAPAAYGNPSPAPPPYPAPREPSASDRVIAYYTGLQIGISPGIILPANGGDVGFLLALYGGYGIESGGIVLVPGAHATGAWPSGEFIGTFTPAMKLVFPLGAFAPYVEAGAGPGYVSVSKKVGAALRAGVGFSVHPSSRFAIGAGVAYETITGTGVSFIGPTLILSF